MIQEAHLHESCGFDQVACHDFVGAARTGVAGRMVVNEDKSKSSSRDYRTENFTWMGA